MCTVLMEIVSLIVDTHLILKNEVTLCHFKYMYMIPRLMNSVLVGRRDRMVVTTTCAIGAYHH
jgi:DNA polymerase III alpha subunit (gram-positive type)